ncbi:MAG: nuclear transport factor 2 family protein [Bacteroidia bacterium]
MLTTEKANRFALDWIQSWNKHNLNSILEHYSEDVEFYSPFIPLLKFNETGRINSKSDLAKYFKIGLDAYPDLTFRLHNVFTGIDTVTIYYTSVNGRMAAEVFQLNENGKAAKVFCNYSSNKSTY